MIEPDLTAAEVERYRRQIGPGVLAPEGQLRLKLATALVTRAGGMGGPAALMLAMGGVGRVIIAHGGTMISPDLNRQVLGAEEVLGKLRAPEFAAHLRSMNRFVEIEALDHEPDDDEALQLARRCDVILACPPTFEERLRLNRAAVAARVPLIDAAQWGMGGTLCVFRPGQTACLECLYPQTPPFEEHFPVVGAISSAIGSLAALEAIKILSGSGQVLWGKMLTYDGYRAGVSIIQLTRRADCSCCAGVN
jgi:molybdopterin/thiamine biosynthesis adenylyltransferase